MRWVKKGLIYCASDPEGWATSHATLPTPYRINADTLRIYCAFCTKDTVSRIGYVDVQAGNPGTITGVSARPLLDIGQPGTFDDNGVVPISIVEHGGRLYLYYVGFQLGIKVRYFLFSGLAISEDGGQTFKRFRQTPILDRSDSELFFRTAPHVIKEENLWKMWYIAGNRWIEHQGKKLPEYTVKYPESPDGLHWGNEGRECLHLQGDEHGFGRPYVVKNETGYRMYYSIRSLSKGYRLGYAESPDGVDWVRKDSELGLDISAQGWDSDSICYSSVVSCNGRTYLFYNGNNFGQTGFGYAELACA